MYCDTFIRVSYGLFDHPNTPNPVTLYLSDTCNPPSELSSLVPALLNSRDKALNDCLIAHCQIDHMGKSGNEMIGTWHLLTKAQCPLTGRYGRGFFGDG